MKYFFITIFVLFFFACSGHLDKSINRDDYNDNDVNDVDDKKQDMDYKSLLNIEDVQLPQLPQLPNVSQCSKGWKKVCLKSNVCYCDFKINEEKCNGCGQCIPNCKEGALKIIDGKARLISDLFLYGFNTPWLAEVGSLFLQSKIFSFF